MALGGTAALLNWSDVAEADRPEYYTWHVREHMVGRIGIPGFLRGRRYAALQASSDYFQFYELAETEVLQSAPYRALANAPTPLTQRVTKRILNSHRMVARQVLSIGSGQAGCLLTLRLQAGEVDASAFDARLTREVAEEIRARPMITGVHVFATPDAPGRIVLVEGLSAEALAMVGDTLRTTLAMLAHHVRCELFRHEFTVTPDDASHS
jgi:hypothetical protein